MTNNELYPNQIKQHNKEREAIDFLINNGYISKDDDYTNTNKDRKEGVDIKYNGQLYDIKASNTYKLTLFKAYDGKDWVCPILNHIEIPYLYMVEEGKGYTGYIIDKARILQYIGLLTSVPMKCVGIRNDGHINQCLDLRPNLDLFEEIHFYNKDID